MTKELHANHASLHRDRAMAKVRALGGKFGDDEQHGSPFEVGLIAVGDPEPLGIELPPLPELVFDTLPVDDAIKLADEPTVAEPQVAEIVGPAPPPDEPPPLVEAREALDAAIAEAFVGEVIVVAVEASPSDEQVAGESLILDKSWRGGDAGMASLREVPRLVSLSIDHAPLTDAALDHLAALADLAELDIRGTAFTSAGLYKFRERRPTTRVYAIGTAMLGVNAQHRGKCELTGVYQGSGAFEADLKPADEIVAVEGRKIRDFGDLTIAVYSRRPGDKVKVEFRRNGQPQSAEVTLKERKELAPAR